MIAAVRRLRRMRGKRGWRRSVARTPLPTEENLPQLTEQWDAGVVLLLTDVEIDGSRLAQAVPAPAEGKRLIVYRGLHGRTLFPEEGEGKCTVVRLTPAACEDSFLDLAGQIAFRSHFLYEREQDAGHSLRYIRQSYEQDAYNYTSSQDTALAVKCRLWSAGVPWTNNPEQDAARFAEKLRESPRLTAQISWLEHRRWVASKLVQGARPLPPEEFSCLEAASFSGNGTSIRRTEADGKTHLYHVYLTSSKLDGDRPQGWETPGQWEKQPLDTPLPPGAGQSGPGLRGTHPFLSPAGATNRSLRRCGSAAKAGGTGADVSDRAGGGPGGLSCRFDGKPGARCGTNGTEGSERSFSDGRL